MGSFYRRAALFLLLAAGVIQLWAAGVHALGWDRRTQVGHVVWETLAIADRPHPAPVILVGDSVGDQLYGQRGRNRPDIEVLCSTAAISLAGHYFTLGDVARHGGLRGKTVVLLFHPNSFAFDLRDVFVYQYFLKPFYRKRYFPDFAATVFDRINPVPWKAALLLPSIRFGNWVPDWRPTPVAPAPGFRYFSPMSREYLPKLIARIRAAGGRLLIRPPPINQQWAAENLDLGQWEREINQLNLREAFAGYREALQFWPAEKFKTGDPIHFKQDVLDALADDPLQIAELAHGLPGGGAP